MVNPTLTSLMPQHLPIRPVALSWKMLSLEHEVVMGRHLTLREALALRRLADFVRQAEARGAELTSGSDFERACLAHYTAPADRKPGNTASSRSFLK